MILELEKIICEYLQPIADLGLAIKILPRGAREISAPGTEQALVCYSGSQFSRQLDQNGMQDRVSTIEILLQVLNLEIGSADTSWIDLIHARLTGFRPFGDGEVLPKSDRFIDVNASTSIWTYLLSYELSVQFFRG